MENKAGNLKKHLSLTHFPRSAVLAAVLGLSLSSFVGPVSLASYSAGELRSVMTANEVKIFDIRDQEINQLRITLGRRNPASRRADLYFRLAEIYLEAYRATFLLEGRVHEKRLEKKIADPVINRDQSIPYAKLAIKACEEILALKIPFNRMAEVYYFLGLNYGELENTKQSQKYFELLVNNYPSSAFAQEAHLELGEVYYGKKDYRQAISHYEIAVKKLKGGQLSRALHRMGWAYYRTKQYDRAVQTLKLAVTASGDSQEALVSIRDEILRDLALFMTETGKVEEAVSYFQEVAGERDYYPKALEALGKQFERNVEPAKAALVYESLLKTRPRDEAAFRVLVKLVDLDLRRARPSEALARLKVGESIFEKSYGRGDADTLTASQNLKAMIRRTATENHEAYRKKKAGRSALETAEQFYSAYLEIFLSRGEAKKEVPEIEMYLADVKRELGKAKEASALYRKVVDSSDERYSKEAGALWTASLADAMQKEAAKSSRPESRADSGDPSPLESEFVDAADELESVLKDSSESREAQLRAAQVLAGYKSTQNQSLKRVKKLVEKYPRSPQALTAARLWLQMGADRFTQGGSESDFREVIEDIRAQAALMANDQEKGDGKLKAALAEQETRLKIGAIAFQEKEKDFEAAAQGYEEFARNAKKQELAETAYANAVGSYLKVTSGDLRKAVASAIRISQEWLKRFPSSKTALESSRSVATRFLMDGNFQESAELFTMIGQASNDPESLETAARIREGLGDFNGALTLVSTSLRLYPKAETRSRGGRVAPTAHAARVASVAMMGARLSEKLGRESDAVKFYQTCMEGGPEVNALKAQCGASLGDLYSRLKQFEQARATYRRVATLESTPGGRSKKSGKAGDSAGSVSPYVGYARYRLAEAQEEAGRFEKLALPEAQLKKGMNQRIEFLRGLTQSYDGVVEAGGPSAVAALDRLARWVWRFADELDAIALPANAAPEAIAQFRKGIQAVSAPLRDRARKTWNQAYESAVHAELFSSVLPSIADRISPVVAQGFHGRFRLAGLPSDGGQDGRDRAMAKVREKLVRNGNDAATWVDYGNLLWGEGREVLASLAYDRALGLSPKLPAALNNRAVILLSNDGQSEPFKAIEANLLLRQALARDEFFLAAKMNRAALLNYYRLFSQSKPIWDQILLKAAQQYDAWDGLGTALLALGDSQGAQEAFEKSTNLGGAERRFSRLFHLAVLEAKKGAVGAAECLSLLGKLSGAELIGFERESVDYLKRGCERWKERK